MHSLQSILLLPGLGGWRYASPSTPCTMEDGSAASARRRPPMRRLGRTPTPSDFRQRASLCRIPPSAGARSEAQAPEESARERQEPGSLPGGGWHRKSALLPARKEEARGRTSWAARV